MKNKDCKNKRKVIRFKNKDLIKIVLKFALISYIVLSINPVLSSAAPSNLVVNPSFEIGTKIPLNWTFVSSNGNTPLLDTISHSGFRSINISIPGTTNGNSGYPRSDLIKAKTMTYYDFSAWGKIRNVWGTYEPAVRAVELDSNKNWIRQINLDFGRGTKDWTQINTTFRTGNNTAYLLVYANIYNSYGMFWVDDINLQEKVSASTSVTSPITIPTTGAVYYVSNNGNNGNSGSLTSPWKTISYAVGGQSPVKSGDTVVVRAGTYNEQVTINVGGTSSTNKVTLMAYPSEHVDISCKGLGLTGWTGCIQAWKTNYITIQGLHIQDSDTWGILLYGDIYGVTVDSNTISNIYHSGIMSERPWNLVVSRNEIYEVSHDEQWEAISIIAGHGTSIKNNHIHNVDNIGIDLKEGSWDSIVEGNYVHDLPPCPSYCGNGIYIDARGNAENNTITRNKIANVALFGIVISSETDGTLRKTMISNNIISNSELDGIGVGVYTTTNNVYIYDTTIIDNVVYGGTGGGIQLGQDPKIKVSGTIIRNNIVAYAPDFQIAVRPQVTSSTIDHNLIYPYRGTDSAETRGTYYIESDPKFVSPSALDFHLLSTSPAIDKGSPTNAPLIDYYGNSRPQGNGFDIGAIEYI